jgi:hypothetical protein
MYRLDDCDLLEITVRARVEIWPENVCCVRTVDHSSADIGINVYAVEVMRVANTTQRAQGAAKIHLVACGQDTATALAEKGDAAAIFLCQSVSRVDSCQGDQTGYCDPQDNSKK